ncbi:MAG: TPM domain-containing protein [Victivallales bacterium]|nr:TPM domain-containing protein [Victivallales bacterium]
MKHFPLTVLLALIATGIFAQVPPKPSEKAVVYDYADMLTPEDKVSIELMGLKLQSKYDSKLLFISVETKGNMKGVDFVRAIYSGWGISDGVKGHCGLIVVCKKQIMASAGGGFLVKCDNALTIKVKDSFQELLDKTTLPPFNNVENQNPQKGSAALKDSYLFFANAMIELSKEEATANTQTADSPKTAETEAVVQTVPPSNEQTSPKEETPMAPPTPTTETPMTPSAPTAGRTMAFPKTTWIICGLILVGIVGIIFLLKKGNRSHTSNNKNQHKHKDYDSTDYRDDN